MCVNACIRMHYSRSGRGARELLADAGDERIDVGLGGVERAHPAHLVPCGIPRVEPEPALTQPLGDARGERGEDAVRLGLLREAEAAELSRGDAGVEGVAQATGHGVRMRRVAQIEVA